MPCESRHSMVQRLDLHGCSRGRRSVPRSVRVPAAQQAVRGAATAQLNARLNQRFAGRQVVKSL